MRTSLLPTATSWRVRLAGSSSALKGTSHAHIQQYPLGATPTRVPAYRKSPSVRIHFVSRHLVLYIPLLLHSILQLTNSLLQRCHSFFKHHALCLGDRCHCHRAQPRACNSIPARLPLLLRVVFVLHQVQVQRLPLLCSSPRLASFRDILLVHFLPRVLLGKS